MQSKKNRIGEILDPENMVLATEIIFLPIMGTELCPILHFRLMADHGVIYTEQKE